MAGMQAEESSTGEDFREAITQEVSKEAMAGACEQVLCQSSIGVSELPLCSRSLGDDLVPS